MAIDHVLMIGFGGPTKPEEIRPFLEQVTKGTNVPPQRLDAVARHYEATGGRSPYNPLATELFDRVRASLAASGLSVPAFLGMRNWSPFLGDVLADIHGRGLCHGIGVVLAPQRSAASFSKYVQTIEEVKITLGAQQLRYDYLKPWHEHPLFIEAQADRVRQAMAPLPAEARSRAHLLFCAHSIPMAMFGRAEYEAQVQRSSKRVAEALTHSSWSLCYQSRSGSPREPWLEPDVLLVLRELRDRGVARVVVVPVGFLFDHTEVLYDLDIEAREEARRLELGFIRAPTVMNHPRFVEMFVQLIREQAGLAAKPAGSSASR